MQEATDALPAPSELLEIPRVAAKAYAAEPTTAAASTASSHFVLRSEEMFIVMCPSAGVSGQ